VTESNQPEQGEDAVAHDDSSLTDVKGESPDDGGDASGDGDETTTTESRLGVRRTRRRTRRSTSSRSVEETIDETIVEDVVPALYQGPEVAYPPTVG
jgi:hypothetical protein